MNRSYLSICVCVVLLVGGCVAARAAGQETAAEPPAESPQPPNATDSVAAPDAEAAQRANGVFTQKFDEYKSALREIEKLNADYQSADEATREKINQQLTGQVAHAQSLVNALVEAGVEAYRAEPNADPKITDLLLAVSRYHAIGRQIGPGAPSRRNPQDIYYPIDGGDQYEKALPTIKLLIDGGAEQKQLFVWGFLSAFATNDHELAKEYLAKAEQSGASKELADSAEKTDSQDTQAGLMGSVMHQFTMFSSILDEYRELWKKESSLRAAEAAADNLPRVKLTTTKGEITLELFENEAPQSVANFISLVKQGFYNGSPFHRVLPKFMAQGGAKDDQGEGGPGYRIRCECYRPDNRRHFRGTLSMAHAGRDTGSSQFFLTFAPTPHLNGRHTAFGRVIEGMEVLADLQRRSADHQATPPADRILKAEVIRDRGHEYTFEKLPEI